MWYKWSLIGATNWSMGGKQANFGHRLSTDTWPMSSSSLQQIGTFQLTVGFCRRQVPFSGKGSVTTWRRRARGPSMSRYRRLCLSRDDLLNLRRAAHQNLEIFTAQAIALQFWAGGTGWIYFYSFVIGFDYFLCGFLMQFRLGMLLVSFTTSIFIGDYVPLHRFGFKWGQLYSWNEASCKMYGKLMYNAMPIQMCSAKCGQMPTRKF